MLNCTIYLVRNWLESRRIARPMRLIRVINVRNGRIVTFECFLCFTVLAWIAGAVWLVGRKRSWESNFGNGSAKGGLIVGILCQIPLVVLAIIFSLSNLAGIMAVRSRAQSWDSLSKQQIWFYNLGLVFLFVVFFCLVIVSGEELCVIHGIRLTYPSAYRCRRQQVHKSSHRLY